MHNVLKTFYEVPNSVTLLISRQADKQTHAIHFFHPLTKVMTDRPTVKENSARTGSSVSACDSNLLHSEQNFNFEASFFKKLLFIAISIGKTDKKNINETIHLSRSMPTTDKFVSLALGDGKSRKRCKFVANEAESGT